MALTPSVMPELGSPAPHFELPATDGKMVSIHDFEALPGLLVMFICNHCPYVIHLKKALAEFGKSYQGRLGMVAISSNNVDTHPQDGPEAMAADARQNGYVFPYLYDESQAVARAYQAACTPDFFLYDSTGHLVYRGQFDESRPQSGHEVTGRDLRAACDALLEGRPISPLQVPSMGCNIKWKPDQKPD